MARSCIVYKSFSPTTSGPVFSPAVRVEKRPGGQQMTSQREMKRATVGLNRMGSLRLPSWGQTISKLDDSGEVVVISYQVRLFEHDYLIDQTEIYVC